jgi:uncharacterized protein
MLLHNIEHFDFYFAPPNLPDSIKAIDRSVWDSLFFLFGGKSYAIFSLLFGLTFFIQSDNQAKKGKDFRGRFAWRLILLLGFGLINSAFYEGDILTFYVCIGFFLIPVAKLSDKAVFWIATFLMLQPFEWFMVYKGAQNPIVDIADPSSWAYFGRMWEYIPGDSLFNTLYGNLTNGKVGVFIWCWEVGRVFQTLSLFMFGMLLGRKLLFVTSAKSKSFWIRSLIISTFIFIPLYIVKNNLGGWIEFESIRRPLTTIETSYTNMAFMFILVSGIVLLYQTKFFNRILKVFTYFGRMSLSNYVMQSIVGSIIYYGFGFGLYQYTGATYSVIIGLLLAVLQGMFCYYWLKKYNQGPLEILWHKGTWIGAK